MVDVKDGAVNLIHSDHVVFGHPFLLIFRRQEMFRKILVKTIVAENEGEWPSYRVHLYLLYGNVVKQNKMTINI